MASTVSGGQTTSRRNWPDVWRQRTPKIGRSGVFPALHFEGQVVGPLIAERHIATGVIERD